jgi:hypothetical protein
VVKRLILLVFLLATLLPAQGIIWPHQIRQAGATLGQCIVWDGSKWAPDDCGSGEDGGITSLGGLTGATQTFATGTTGSDFGISSSGTTHTFNLPTASASSRGLLSTTDWSTFNGKESALTFTAPLSRATNTISLTLGTANQFLGVNSGATSQSHTAQTRSPSICPRLRPPTEERFPRRTGQPSTTKGMCPQVVAMLTRPG